MVQEGVAVERGERTKDRKVLRKGAGVRERELISNQKMEKGDPA